MKKTLVMATVILTALSMSSCRSSKTLSQATTVANPAGQQVEEVAPIVYTNPQRQTTTTTTPVAQPGDKTEVVTVVNQADAGLLKSYNVVVGAFGNKSNADNFRAKMVSRGYNAFLVQNPQGLYRVVAGGYDQREAAAQVRDVIRTTYANDDPGTCPMAWILIPAR